MKILVRMPTRQRPGQALHVLGRYQKLAGMPIAIEAVIDIDDPSMMANPVLLKLREMGIIVTAGMHQNKIEAVNGGLAKDWDVLVLASDDMHPIKEGYAVRIAEEMQKHFPRLDGALHFNDGYQKANLYTLPILGRRLVEQFDGKVYEPSYKSLFCDTEQTALLNAMGRLVYIDECLIEHRHHVFGASVRDELYARNDSLWHADKQTFEKRFEMIQPHSQFRFNAPPLWLSICIATIPGREERLRSLTETLFDQIHDYAPRQVEIIVDDGPESIGAKRQRMIEKSRGHFVAHVDDDDRVSPDYIKRIVGKLRENPTTDCLSLLGVLCTRDANPEMFEHSIAHKTWYSRNGVHCRTPNHLNAIRRDIALQVGFKQLAKGEDADFSFRARDLLRNEVSTGGTPLYFYQK